MYERYWIVSINTNGFESKMLFQGTEEELHEYLTSEIGYMPKYVGATDKEVEMARVLQIKIYLCPKLSK